MHATRRTTVRTSPRRGRILLLLTVLVIAAAAFRLFRIGEKSLWLDEIMTVHFSLISCPPRFPHLDAHDAHPPLFQIIEWLWLRFGSGDGFARLPAAFFGIAGVALTWLVARRLAGRFAAGLASIIMAVSWFHVYYSQEARLHTMATALVLLQVYLLIRILDRGGRAGWGLWAAYGVVILASLYTYALCILTIAAAGLAYLLLNMRRRRWQWTQLIVTHAAVALLFLPWLPTMRTRTSELSQSVAELGDSAGRPALTEILRGVASWGIGPVDWSVASSAGLAVGLALVVFAVAGFAFRRRRRPVILLGVLFFLPLAGYWLMPMPRVHAYDPKHLVFLQPLLVIALAGFRLPLKLPARHAHKPALYLAVLLAVANLWMLSDYYRPGFHKEQWRQVHADLAVNLRSNDGIVPNPEYIGFAIEHYARDPEERAALRESIAQTHIGRPVNRIWLVECRSPVARPEAHILSAILESGWAPAREKAYPGHIGNIRTVLFVRPEAMDR